MIEEIYDAAARAGFLKTANIGGQPVSVEFRVPDETVLGGMASSHDYSMRLPASRLGTLARGDTLAIESINYRVRDLIAVGDGSEYRVSLTRL